MSHGIQTADRAAYSFEPAWHGLGVTHDFGMNIDDVRDAIAGYAVEQAPGWLPYDPNTGRVWRPSNGEAPPDYIRWLRTEAVFNLRTDLALPDNRALLSPSGVGEGYEVVQNSELCDIAEVVAGETGATYETCGTLRDGKLVWILCKWPDDASIQGDRIGRHLLIYSSHDSSHQIVVQNTSIRVVCANTLNAALSRKHENQCRMRHTKNVRERIAEAIRLVQLSGERFAEETERLDRMSRKAVSDRFVQGFLLALYPDPAESKITAHAEQKRERILALTTEQPGASGAALRTSDGQLTAYGFYNAICQYWQHESRTAARAGTDPVEQRFRSNLMGSQAERRAEALRNLQPERIDALTAAAEHSEAEFATNPAAFFSNV